MVAVDHRLGRTFATAALAVLGVALLLVPNQLAAMNRAPQGGSEISFTAIASAETRLVARIRQTRSVFQADGQGGASWASIDESLVLGGRDAEGNQLFRLNLDSVPGEQLDPVELEQRRALHASHAGYLQQFETFRIEDPLAAARNYSLLHLDDRQRLGRTTHRIAVIPRQFGRSAWILELDAATLYPLFSAEISAFGMVVSTLEVTSFAPTNAVGLGAVTWWTPTMSMARFRDANAAANSLGVLRPATLEGTHVPADYRLVEARAVRDDLRPESSLVLVYGDGLDSLFVVETYGAPPPPLPWSSPTDTSAPYAIFSYQDQNVSQYMFYVRGVRTLVIGRATHFELASLAESLLVQAKG